MINRLAVAALALLSQISANRSKAYRTECLATTKEFGNIQTGLMFQNGISNMEGIFFTSNMDDLVNELQEKVLFMRTSDLKVCHDDKYIHGIRVALIHDYQKDPDHNKFLDSYYSDTILSDHDRKYYMHIDGGEEGYCKNIPLRRDEKIESIKIMYDDWVRAMEFTKNTGQKILLGQTDSTKIKNLKYDIVNFNENEEIVGVFGTIQEIQKGGTIMRSTTYISK